MENADVIVIGGGIAGLSAATRLVDERKNVVLLESRDVIGGRTSSWIERGMPVESGLHRFLGFYSALPELLKHVGIDLDSMLFWEDEVEIITPDGGPKGIFGASPLHNPIKTIENIFGNNDLLSPSDKLSLIPFFTAGMKDYVANPEELDSITVLEFAKKHKVTKHAIERILVPATAGIFFLPPERYSMYALMGLIVPYIPTAIKTRVGAFMGGMSEVMCQPIVKYIESKEGTVLLGEQVEDLILKEDVIVGIKSSKRTLMAKHVILATSLFPAQQLLKKHFKNHQWFADFFALSSMPAITIQFELKKRSLPMDRTTFGPGTSWASFAEQNETTFRHCSGRLSIILTPPEKFLTMNDKEILENVIRDGKRLGIDIVDTITDFRITRIPHDFYALTPGSEKLRPSQKTPVSGLLLAGDYTKQPYLATMEGAVVSGKTAAEIILNEN